MLKGIRQKGVVRALVVCWYESMHLALEGVPDMLESDRNGLLGSVLSLNFSRQKQSLSLFYHLPESCIS